MKLGAYTACLHDKPLAEETLKILRDLGLTSAEINAGGFIRLPHLPIESCERAQTARDDYLGIFDRRRHRLDRRSTATATRSTPTRQVGPKHAHDLLGVDRGRRAAGRQAGGHHVGPAAGQPGRDRCRPGT